MSPAPNFAEWLKRERANAASVAIDEDDREVLAALALASKRRPEQYVGVGFIDDDNQDDNEDSNDDADAAIAVSGDPPRAGAPPRLDASGIPRTD